MSKFNNISEPELRVKADITLFYSSNYLALGRIRNDLWNFWNGNWGEI